MQELDAKGSNCSKALSSITFLLSSSEFIFLGSTGFSISHAYVNPSLLTGIFIIEFPPSS